MAKYTPLQLKEMAQRLKNIEHSDPFRYGEFLFFVAMLSGRDIDYITKKIDEYAAYGGKDKSAGT